MTKEHVKTIREWLENYKKFLTLSEEEYEYMNKLITSFEEKFKEGEKDE